MDTEIGLYYLVTRYYDPVTYRFINADGYFQTGAGGFLDKNMNAYCHNNPVMFIDPTGELVISTLIAGILIGAIISGGIEIGTQLMQNGGKLEEVDWVDVGLEAANGAITGGLLVAMPANYVVATAVTRGVLNGATTYAHELHHGSGNSEAFGKAVFSTGTTMLLGGLAKYELANALGAGQRGILNRGQQAVYNWSTSVGKSWSTTGTRSVVRSANTFIKQTTKKVTPKSCAGCGRPIGNAAWECSGGWTY